MPPESKNPTDRKALKDEINLMALATEMDLTLFVNEDNEKTLVINPPSSNPDQPLPPDKISSQLT